MGEHRLAKFDRPATPNSGSRARWAGPRRLFHSEGGMAHEVSTRSSPQVFRLFSKERSDEPRDARRNSFGAALRAVRSVFRRSNPQTAIGGSRACTVQEFSSMQTAAMASQSDDEDDAEPGEIDGGRIPDLSTAAGFVAANPGATPKELVALAAVWGDHSHSSPSCSDVAMLAKLAHPPAKKDVMAAFLLTHGSESVHPTDITKRRPPLSMPQRSWDICLVDPRELPYDLSDELVRMPCLSDIPHEALCGPVEFD